jgi:hypothetical protein
MAFRKLLKKYKRPVPAATEILSSPVCFQNERDIQEAYRLPPPPPVSKASKGQ